MSESAPTYRVVIVGGGAGVLPLASRLGDTLGRRGRAEITLIDRCETHVWKPLLHEVAAGRMDADAHEVDYFALAHWHRFRFRQGELSRLDRARHIVSLAPVYDDDGEEVLPARELAYDTLVFCVGSVSNDFGIAGVAEHAISLDTPVDAGRFHRKLLSACVRADAQAAQGKPAKVHIVIIGAGATGVELAAEIRQTTRAHAGYGLDYLHPAEDIAITVVEAAPRILPPLSERIASAASDLLRNMQIEVRTGTRVSEVRRDAVELADGTSMPADLIVWAAGIQAPSWLRDLDGLEVNRSNQLVVELTLQTTRDTEVFAFGDCAACPWPESPKPGAIVPPRAQAAHQQATMLQKTIAARLEGRPLPMFRYRDFGSLVSLGEVSAVGTLMGRLVGKSMLVQGLIARWMYATLYKLHQISVHGYWRVTLDTLGRFLRRTLEPRVKLH